MKQYTLGQAQELIGERAGEGVETSRDETYVTLRIDLTEEGLGFFFYEMDEVDGEITSVWGDEHGHHDQGEDGQGETRSAEQLAERDPEERDQERAERAARSAELEAADYWEALCSAWQHGSAAQRACAAMLMRLQEIDPLTDSLAARA